MVEEKTYDKGIEDGYNFAVQKVLEALGIKLAEPEAEEEGEFLNKPKQ